MAAEHTALPASQTIVETVGYEAGSEVPVFLKTYSTVCVASYGLGLQMPGDVAAVVKYTTDQRSTKNHPIFLFNYYHGAFGQSSQPIDALNNDMKLALQTYATAWLTGFSDGSTAHHRAGPRGAVAQTRVVLDYLRHRDFRG